MSSDREQIERGMQLVDRLPDIMPDQADTRIKLLYEDIQQTLRVPLINLIFRTLANYPDYLETAWRQIRPAVCTQAFEAVADDLRAQALSRYSPSILASTSTFRDLDRLRSFNDTIHYVLPKLLLIATALHKPAWNGMEEEPWGRGGGREQHVSELPQGIIEGTTNVDMVDPENATGPVKALFQNIKERHGHTLVSSYYRGLANWPDFLEVAWSEIEPRVGSAQYEGCRQHLIEQASFLTQKFLRHGPRFQNPEEDQTQEIQMILAAFRLKFIPEMLIDVSLVKAMLDGAESATRARFSASTIISERNGQNHEPS